MRNELMDFVEFLFHIYSHNRLYRSKRKKIKKKSDAWSAIIDNKERRRHWIWMNNWISNQVTISNQSQAKVWKCHRLAKSTWTDRQFCRWMIALQSCKSKVAAAQQWHQDQEHEAALVRVHVTFHRSPPHPFHHASRYAIGICYSNWIKGTKCALHSNWNEYVTLEIAYLNHRYVTQIIIKQFWPTKAKIKYISIFVHECWAIQVSCERWLENRRHSIEQWLLFKVASKQQNCLKSGRKSINSNKDDVHQHAFAYPYPCDLYVSCWWLGETHKRITKTFSFLYLLCLQKSMKIKPQNVIGARGRRQLIRPTAALINTPNTRRRLRRSNSVAKQIAT